jgi:aspartate 1-decarboxylase
MLKFMLKSKLHRATVTGADINYEGSITIDEGLMEKADLVGYERVDIYDISNGERFSTYVIPGKRDSGIFCLNGAAARKVATGDLIIVASYAMVDEAEAVNWKPKKVLLDKDNRIKSILN